MLVEHALEKAEQELQSMPGYYGKNACYHGAWRKGLLAHLTNKPLSSNPYHVPAPWPKGASGLSVVQKKAMGWLRVAEWDVHKSTRTMEALVRRGMIEQKPYPHDRGKALYRLTPAGLTVRNNHYCGAPPGLNLRQAYHDAWNRGWQFASKHFGEGGGKNEEG